VNSTTSEINKIRILNLRAGTYGKSAARPRRRFAGFRCRIYSEPASALSALTSGFSRAPRVLRHNTNNTFHPAVVGTDAQYAEQIYAIDRLPSTGLSHLATDAGLLLRAQQSGDIDRLLHGRRSASARWTHLVSASACRSLGQDVTNTTQQGRSQNQYTSKLLVNSTQ